MNSLRLRMLLATVFVAAIAVTASAFFARQVVTHEFLRFVGVHPVDLGPLRAELAAHTRSSETSAGFDAALARHARLLGRALVLVDSSGAVLASSAPLLRTARVVFGEGGRIRLTGARDGGAPGDFALELRRPPSAIVRDGAGRVLGTILVLPEAGPPEARTGSFLTGVQRGVALGALVAIALGAVLVWLLSSRLLGPIEQLTAATRRMAGGDLATRVPVRGRDEIATLAGAFNAMAESLERSHRLRRQLTHDVAHELRTPLTNLRAQIEALEDGLLDATPDTLLSLRTEVALLTGLVTDLEQIARAEAGDIPLERVDLDVPSLLRQAVAAFAPRARGRNLGLEVHAEPGLTVCADEHRVAQILRNLIENAITHTPDGGQILLRGRRVEGSVVLAVQDSGPGIPPEHRAHVFDRFYRADPSRSRGTGGAGLGLAIVKSLVHAHGGEVWVESPSEGGTAIAFSLPGP